MAGTGYNIPISVAASETLSIPTSYNAPNNITFGNAYLLGDSSAQSNPVQPSTANATSAEGGNASTSSQGSGVSGSGSSANGGGSNTLLYVAAGGSLLAVVAVIFLVVKHKV